MAKGRPLRFEVRLNDLPMQHPRSRRTLHRFRNLVNPVELLAAIGLRQEKWMIDNLRRAGRIPGGIPHKKMAASTLAKKKARSSAMHLASSYQAGLAQSFNFRILGRNSVLVGTKNQHAQFHHFGTGPHIITARGRALRFKGLGGEEVFAEHVFHPGIPRRRLLPTKAVAERMTVRLVEEIIKKKIAKAGLGPFSRPVW